MGGEMKEMGDVGGECGGDMGEMGGMWGGDEGDWGGCG